MFKKNKKEKNELDQKVNMNKKTIIVIEVVVALIIFASAIGIKVLMTNKNRDNIVRLSDQTVKGITFSDFQIVYEDNKSKVSVNLINETEEDVKVGTLVMKLYASDNTQMSEVRLPYNIVLEPNQSIEAENGGIEINLLDITKVEYVIE